MKCTVKVCCEFYSSHIDCEKMVFLKGTVNLKSSAIKVHFHSKSHLKAGNTASAKDTQNTDPATSSSHDEAARVLLSLKYSYMWLNNLVKT